MIPILTTERLFLRGFTDQDADALHDVLSERDVNRYFPRTDPPTREQVVKIIASQLAHWEKHNCGWWAVILRESQKLIGWCGLQFLPEFNEVEVAYLLGKPYWGRGLATEAAWAATQFGFQSLGLERIVALAHVENAASQRVIQKLGMSQVEQLNIWGIDCYRYLLPRATFVLKSDTASVESLLRALYEGISYQAGAQPDWERLRSLFIEGVRIIPPAPDSAVAVLDFDGFKARVSEGIARRGEVDPGFYESELARRVETFGNIAHVWSTYESRHTAQDPAPFSRGINSFQFVRHQDRWWVVIIFWDVERQDNPIPGQYLPEH